MPKILFVHQNFPAQFGAFGEWLAGRGWEVVFATAREDPPFPKKTRGVVYKRHRDVADGAHPYLRSTETAVLNGQGFARAAIGLSEKGFRPDIVMAHSGWGSGTFAKAVWPDTIYIPYIEWWYRYPAVDVEGEATEGNAVDSAARQLVRNTPMMLDLAAGDAALAPTAFQAAQVPAHFRNGMTVLHDGVDTGRLSPDPDAVFEREGLRLSRDDEVLTFIGRGLEPQRGFPDFMRALALLQARRPKLQALIVGANRVAYGKKLPEGESWKARMLEDLPLDEARIHFTGLLPPRAYVQALRISAVHCYLSVPFVLSWSAIEAMATGCALVGSDNPATAEAMRDGIEARLVDPKDPEALAAAIGGLLDDPEERARLGAGARARALDRYDRAALWPAREGWMRSLIAERRDQNPAGP